MRKNNVRTHRVASLGGIFAALLLSGALAASCASAPGSTEKKGGTPVAVAANGKTAMTAPGSELVGPAWLLAGYDTGTFFVPLEPGHGTTARLVFSADGKLSGSSGFTAFSGTWKAGKPDPNGYAPIALTSALSGGSRAPNDTAAKFERDLLACLASARMLKKEKDSFRLLDGQKRILLRYLSASAE